MKTKDCSGVICVCAFTFRNGDYIYTINLCDDVNMIGALHGKPNVRAEGSSYHFQKVSYVSSYTKCTLVFKFHVRTMFLDPDVIIETLIKRTVFLVQVYLPPELPYGNIDRRSSDQDNSNPTD